MAGMQEAEEKTEALFEALINDNIYCACICRNVGIHQRSHITKSTKPSHFERYEKRKRRYVRTHVYSMHANMITVIDVTAGLRNYASALANTEARIRP